MSEKPSPKPSASEPAARTAGDGTSAGSKGAPAAGKAKSGGEPDESFHFLVPPQSPGELGRLANYRVLKVLGKGGMGIVFMAEDTRLHRIVALKVMLPAIAKKDIARDRFIREARATAAIEHDHIVTIYEVNEDNDVPYLAMQFLKGMTLEDWLKAGKTLNVPQVMRIGKEIAKGLAAAHARGLIHRDIKPSNIWLDAVNKGRVKILDFGLARPTNEETHLTQEGMILGSPAYMSPEQARGQGIDERVDLFSLGCVLYRLCAGRLPFNGKDAMSVLLAITSDEPAALKKLNEDLPPALADLVHQLLAKTPAERPASAKAVVHTIQNIERDWIANARTMATRPVRDTAAGSTTQDATSAVEKPADIDPALEESAITDLELQPTQIPGMTPAPPRGRSWVLAGLGCSLVSVLLLVCCMGIAIATNHGHVKISAEDDARPFLEEDGLTLWDHNSKAHTLKLGELHRLPSGGYHVDAAQLPKGLQVEPNPFSLHRGETLEIKVRYGMPMPTIVMVTADQARKIQHDWASYLKRPLEETTSLDAKMMLIPPGEFMMGTSKELLAALSKKFDKKILLFSNEAPPHRVKISKPFYLGAREVTHGEFRKFVTEKSYLTVPKASKRGGTGIETGRDSGRKSEFDWVTFGPDYLPKDEHPVSNITWKDAEAFCQWLSEKEKKIYRLPTEAEWEYACRAGMTSFWSFGDDFREKEARAHMWYHVPLKFTANPATPKPVGKLTANGFGLHDMHGNVAEMCADYWEAAYYQKSPKDGLFIDPKGPEPAAGMRVARGGSFLDTANVTRSANRQAVDPSLGFSYLGFRIVCELPQPLE